MSGNDGLRADARENRVRILRVATEALKADPEASLNAIAKAAGVGAGTLYRHFPDRESLVLAVYRQEILDLAESASTLLARHPPLEAFRRWCDRLILFGKMKSGVADILDAARSVQGFPDAYGPLVAALKTLMAACEASGDFLPGANAEDFLLLLGFMGKLLAGPSGEARTRRLMALVFRGLCAPATRRHR